MIFLKISGVDSKDPEKGQNTCVPLFLFGTTLACITQVSMGFVSLPYIIAHLRFINKLQASTPSPEPAPPTSLLPLPPLAIQIYAYAEKYNCFAHSLRKG